MNCNIIKDLIPLYIDNCCSEESEEEIKKHLTQCDDCRAVFEEMNAPIETTKTVCPPKASGRINQWKASVLQSVLFLASFLFITVGVYFEAQLSGFGNGLVAFNMVVPATAFMLSLTNWYFVRFYKSRKLFSWCSLAITLAITVCATVWTCNHYGFSFTEAYNAYNGASLIDFAESVCFLFRRGIALTAVFAAAAKILSNFYARLIGKE